MVWRVGSSSASCSQALGHSSLGDNGPVLRLSRLESYLPRGILMILEQAMSNCPTQDGVWRTR